MREREIDSALKTMFDALEGPPDPVKHAHKSRLRYRVVVPGAVVLAGAVAGLATAVISSGTTVTMGVGCGAPELQYDGAIYGTEAPSAAENFAEGPVLGTGTTPACPGDKIIGPDGKTTTEPDKVASHTVTVHAIEGVRPALAVWIDPPLEDVDAGIYVLLSRCVALERGRCLRQHLQFQGHTYAPTNTPTLRTIRDGVAGAGELTNGGRHSSVPVLRLQGIPTSSAVAVAGLPDRIFIADAVCNRLSDRSWAKCLGESK
jgi:hypothetical protein